MVLFLKGNLQKRLAKNNKNYDCGNTNSRIEYSRAGARAVDLGVSSVYQERPKFEIKHKSRCFQKSKFVNWGAKHVDLGGQAFLAPS